MVLMQSADVKPCSVNQSVIKLKLILETDVLLFLFMLMLLVSVGGGSAMKEEQNMNCVTGSGEYIDCQLCGFVALQSNDRLLSPHPDSGRGFRQC